MRIFNRFLAFVKLFVKFGASAKAPQMPLAVSMFAISVMRISTANILPEFNNISIIIFQ